MLRIYNEKPEPIASECQTTRVLLHCGPVSVEAGIEVWTSAEWARESRRPPAHEVFALANGVFLRIGPCDERIHGSSIARAGVKR